MLTKRRFAIVGLIFLLVVSVLLCGGAAAKPDPELSLKAMPSSKAPNKRGEKPQAAIATFNNGNHQVCSQPDPQSWQDGEGVCFVFDKTGKQVAGYYGYPHSDRFICMKGTVNHNQVVGEAFSLLWEGETVSDVSQVPFKWDQEGHLTLSQPEEVRLADRRDRNFSAIHFQTATLDLDNFHHYEKPKMKSPLDLCP